MLKTVGVTEVRFLQSRRAARIAYVVQGSGPPLIALPPWATHLTGEMRLSGHDSFHQRLAERHRVVRYDRWGTGLSDRARSDFSLEADLEVLTDVVEHLKLRRFVLVGPSQAGLLAAVFARRHPERVSHLVLYGTRISALTDEATWPALRALILANWPVAARSIAAVATRGSDPGDVEAFADLFVMAVTPEMAVALQDAAIAPEAAIALAGWIPGARLELLEGEAHVHSAGDAGHLAERICAFTAGAQRAPAAQLTDREAEIVERVAQGQTNAEIAAQLVLSVRTVERHLLNAYTKLGVRGRTEAISQWLQQRADATSDT